MLLPCTSNYTFEAVIGFTVLRYFEHSEHRIVIADWWLDQH